MRRVAPRLAAAALILAAFAGGRAQPQPNVLLIVIDTVRADHLGAYGYARPTSPHLDMLARKGTRFAAARSTTSWTGPSVASILSALYPAVHGVESAQSALSDDAATIAEAFRDGGYATAAFSANPAYVTPEMGFAQGFERFAVLHGPPAQATDPDAVPADPELRSFVKVATADRVTEAALAWLSERTGDQRPFFLYLHFFDPHSAYHPPAAFAARFGVSLDVPLANADQAYLSRSFKAPSAEDLAILTGLYDAEIAFTDAEVGRLLAGVAAASRRRTLVLVTSDHGEEFGDHGGLWHGVTLWEEQLRVPLILAGPGVPRGLTWGDPVSLVSIWPTLAELARVAGPPGDSAPSLTNALTGRASEYREVVYADLALPNPGMPLSVHERAAIDGSWKLVVSHDKQATLFDLETDPGEHHDVRAREFTWERLLHARLRVRDARAIVARLPTQSQELTEERRGRLEALGYLR